MICVYVCVLLISNLTYKKWKKEVLKIAKRLSKEIKQIFKEVLRQIFKKF